MPGRIEAVGCGKTEQPKKFGLGMFDARSWMGSLDRSKKFNFGRHCGILVFEFSPSHPTVSIGDGGLPFAR
jgi:hypothetical protein